MTINVAVLKVYFLQTQVEFIPAPPNDVNAG